MAPTRVCNRIERGVQNDGRQEGRMAAQSGEHRVVDREVHVVLVELVVEAAAHQHLLNVALHERQEHTHADALVLFAHLQVQSIQYLNTLGKIFNRKLLFR